MRDSVRLGSINGIPIGLHWTIALIAGLFIITLSGSLLPALAPGYSAAAYTLVAAATATAFFASIIAHELGHALVAQRNQVGVDGITLFALGGVARLRSEPDNPGAAARIALAGPAVSVAIGVGSLLGSGVLALFGLPTLVTSGLLWLGVINLGMAVFNMLPAFPLDGGRTLQAYLWHRRGDRDRATISAATIGRWFGWALIAFGLWSFINGGGGVFTALIGWFVMSAARAEAHQARFAIQRRNWAPPAWPGVVFTAPGTYIPGPFAPGPTNGPAAGPNAGPGAQAPGANSGPARRTPGPAPGAHAGHFPPPRPGTTGHAGGEPVVEVTGRPVG